MEITLQFEPITVKNQEGEVVLSAPLFDLSLLIGSAISQAVSAGIDKTDQKTLYGIVAGELNKEYKTDLFTWGSASSLSTQVNAAVNELKKNGELKASL